MEIHPSVNWGGKETLRAEGWRIISWYQLLRSRRRDCHLNQARQSILTLLEHRQRLQQVQNQFVVLRRQPPILQTESTKIKVQEQEITNSKFGWGESFIAFPADVICKTASDDSFQALFYMLAEHRLGEGRSNVLAISHLEKWKWFNENTCQDICENKCVDFFYYSFSVVFLTY